MGNIRTGRDRSDIKSKAADFAVRRLIDVMGESRMIFSGIKKQAPIGAPQQYGLEGFREDRVTSADGSQIGLWHKPASDPSKPTYVVFHGRSGHWGFGSNYPAPPSKSGTQKDTCYRHKWLQAMAETGAGVVAVHTRGFGLSANPSIKNITEAALKQDMEAVDDFLQAQNIQPAETIVAGESLGGAMATILSETMAERGHPAGMLGLVNTFSSMSGVLHDTISSMKLGPLQPLKWASEENIRRRMNSPLDTAERIGKLQRDTKLYIAHSPDDEVISPRHADKILQNSQETRLDATFRALTDSYRTTYERHHTNWNPSALVADMEDALRGRIRATPEKANSPSR